MSLPPSLRAPALLLGLLGALPWATVPVAAQAGAEPVLLLPDVMIIDGTGAPAARRMDILIRGSRIRAIRPNGGPVPPGARVLDGYRGLTVMPGLIDAHVHLATSPREPSVAAALGRAVLLGGVTGVRDMGGNTAQLRQIAARWAPDSVPAPRLFSAAVVAGPDGPWHRGARSDFLAAPLDDPAGTANIRAVDPAATRAGVQRSRARGVTAIKLLEDVDLPRLRAATAAARAAGLRVWSHWAIGDVTPMEIVRSGVHTVSHADMATWAMADARGLSDSARLERRLALFEHGRMDDPRLLAVLDTMRARDVALDATLLVFAMAAESERREAAAGARRRYAHLLRFAAGVVRTAHARGVRILAGTDALGGSTPNIHAELQLLVDSAGLPPLEAIRAATLNAAHALGVADSLGSIAVGKVADLVLVDGNPASDIRATLGVRAVMKDGRLWVRDRPLVASGLVQAPSDSVRIARIERRLWPEVTLRGTTDSGWTVGDRLRARGVAGLSVAVIHGGRVAWSRAHGVGDRQTGAPMTSRTLLQAGSLSKPMAAAIGLSLVQSGDLTLDDDVNRWLRNWTVPRDSLTARQPVTLRLLLAHRAGIGVSGFDGYARDSAVPTVLEILQHRGPARGDTVRVEHLPGSRAAYSGGGYLVAQQVMTDASGLPFDSLAARRLFRPLGLERSTFAPMTEQVNGGDVARGYFSDGRPVPGGWRQLPEQAAASLWTTAEEYARFVADLQRAWRGDTSGILAPATVRGMMTLQGDPGDEQGLGVGLKGRPPFRFSHTGWNDGYRAIAIGYLDRGEGIVVLTNADDGDALAMEYVRAVAREYGWDDLAPLIRAAVPVSAADRAALVGRYRLGGDRVIEIALQGDTLVAGPAGRRLLPVHAAQRDDFFFTFSADVGFTIRRGADGRVRGLVWRQGERRTEGRRE